jgi:hypothetical protein
MMDYKLFFAEEYQQNIPLFLTNHQSGTIHSIFENGLNIRMGEKLFFIGTTKNGRLPFGIHLQKEVMKTLLSYIQAPSTVAWIEETEQLFFEESHVFLSLKNGQSFHNSVVKKSASLAPTQYLEDWLTVLNENGETTGLDLDIESFVIDYLEQKQASGQVVQQTERLMKALGTDDADEAEKVIRYFLGRGRGLTPSGDDHLVGLLAIDQVFGMIQPVFRNVLSAILEREAVTTDIGKEYLVYALKGEFSSSITAVLQALGNDDGEELKKHLYALLTTGHSSGVDTAFGMLIGLLTMLNRRN